MKFSRLRSLVPDKSNAGLALLSAILLILAFPDFDYGFLAWFGLIPLLMALDREGSTLSSFTLGWLWGFIFFTGTCWWLTFAPITYAGFPTALAYFLLLCLTAFVGVFPAIFATAIVSLKNRLGQATILAAPFVWVFTEFVRYWTTGNNWNAVGYSQAFGADSALLIYSIPAQLLTHAAGLGGVLMTSFLVVLINSVIAFSLIRRSWLTLAISVPLVCVLGAAGLFADVVATTGESGGGTQPPSIVAIQPNVPMAGLSYERWRQLRTKHIELAESALATIKDRRAKNTTVIFPESPMNFMWEEDEEFRNFVHAFATKNDVQVLFNSAEPDGPSDKYFNSAVLVGPDGKELAQYDKIYLLPFGESVPAPFQAIVPAFVGSFSYGKEYDLLPLGDAKAGVMICFESHFGELSREYVRNGADVLIEMTNDGYLGPTPVLRQHLANAVFRAVETNRPMLRVTNVGITAYINGRGDVGESVESYTEGTKVWSVATSDKSQTWYVAYGDWFAWLCSIVTLGLLGWARLQRSEAKKIFSE
jgi:apolipoprotein N-acyltransferase